MKIHTKLALAVIAAVPMLALTPTASALQAANLAAARTYARFNQTHMVVAAEPRSIEVQVSGKPGTHYQLFLGRADGAKQVVLAFSRIPAGGKIRLALQLPRGLPEMKLCSQADAPIRVRRL